MPTIDEVLSIAARRAVGRRMVRNKNKILRTRRINQRRMASRETLQIRASKAARDKLAKKLTGGKSLATLPLPQRLVISKKLENRAPMIAKLAKRLLPKIINIEKERLRAFKSNTTED